MRVEPPPSPPSASRLPVEVTTADGARAWPALVDQGAQLVLTCDTGIAAHEAVAYAQQREVFGKTLMGFQVTRHKLVEMATKITVAREFNYRVAAKMQAGENVVTEVSMAKNFACEVCDQVVYDAVQIHGGYGYIQDFPVERLYRDAKITQLYEGTSEVQKMVIAGNLLKEECQYQEYA